MYAEFMAILLNQNRANKDLRNAFPVKLMKKSVPVYDSEEQSFRCPKCPFTHIHPSKVRYHMADVCFKTKHIICEICQSSYSYSGLLKHLNHFMNPNRCTKDDTPRARTSIGDTKRYKEQIKSQKNELFPSFNK